MSRLRQQIYRKKLDELLSRGVDENVFTMLWAVRALQSGFPNRAIPFLDFDPMVVTSDRMSKYYIRQWIIETLLNETLAVSKISISKGKNKILRTNHFSTAATLYNTLMKLENADDSLSIPRIGILAEMHRLGQRQFEWQRGFLSLVNFYRSAFLYGGPITRSFFEAKVRFTLDQFMLGCFSMRAVWLEHPVVPASIKMGLVGIDDATAALIVNHVSLPLSEARTLARKLRSGPGHVAYKPSIFRRYPCVAFGPDASRVYAPLADLVMARSTSGLFYDVVGSPGGVRNEIGDRFEIYCAELLEGMITTFQVKRSFGYRVKQSAVQSPDILVRTGNETHLVIECNARRMSYAARFSEDPLSEASDGYNEMVKGIVQIWTYASHARRKIIAETTAHKCCGVILTLDTWLTMAEVLQSEMLVKAGQVADEKDAEIIDADRIPVAFCSVEDLEQTLSVADDLSFLNAVQALSHDDRRGWHLWNVHKEFVPEPSPQRDLPFGKRIGEVLPWWNMQISRSRSPLA